MWEPLPSGNKLEIRLDLRHLGALSLGVAGLVALAFVGGLAMGRNPETQSVQDNYIVFHDVVDQDHHHGQAPERTGAGLVPGSGGVDEALADRASAASPGGQTPSTSGTASPPPVPAPVQSEGLGSPAGGLSGSETRVGSTPAAGVEDGAGRLTVQVGSFRDRREAMNLVESLRSRLYNPYLVEARIPGRGTWYRVRMGKFSSMEAAREFAQDLETREQLETFITPVN